MPRATSSPPDYYAMYTAHNYQFLAYSAAMQGRKAETVLATRNARAVTPVPHGAGCCGVPKLEAGQLEMCHR